MVDKMGELLCASVLSGCQGVFYVDFSTRTRFSMIPRST
jgi:hypothetical protein